MSDAATLLRALIRCPSVTPNEAGVLSHLEGVLRGVGFACHRMTFSDDNTPDVENLFATIGKGAPHFVFAGHTDVVPQGRADLWAHPPFSGAQVDGVLYGRGAQDMKGGIAAFVTAAQAFLKVNKTFRGTLSLLITNDEEGPAINGTVKLLDWCAQQGHRFDACVVGEPTSCSKLGDTIKIGRRGSLSATLSVIGKQGHSAYPHLADNPVHRLARLISHVIKTPLDTGSGGFDPSTIQVTGLYTDNTVFNVIPARAEAKLNIRFNDNWNAETLAATLHERLRAADTEAAYHLDIEQPVAPAFSTEPGLLSDLLSAAIVAETGQTPTLSTSGGTSDARFIKDYCPVVEFGLVGDTMHQTNERVAITDLDRLKQIYLAFLTRYFAQDLQS